MISLTGILSLLSALAATSYALSCTQCNSTTSTTCSGSNETCSPGEQCGSSYAESAIDGGKTFTFLIREFTASFDCDFYGRISARKIHINTISSCCNTDHCTPTIPPFPRQSSEPNGLVCPTCISADSTSCYSPDTIQCTGDENICLLQSTVITGSESISTAIRGCGTKSLCDRGSESSNSPGNLDTSNITCTSGGISVRTVVLAPPIWCLLLLKLFF